MLISRKTTDWEVRVRNILTLGYGKYMCNPISLKSNNHSKYCPNPVICKKSVTKYLHTHIHTCLHIRTRKHTCTYARTHTLLTNLQFMFTHIYVYKFFLGINFKLLVLPKSARLTFIFLNTYTESSVQNDIYNVT